VKLPDIAREPTVKALIKAALKEDVGSGDATSIALVPEAAMSRAVLIAKSKCVVSGTGIAEAVFKQVDKRVKCAVRIKDGAPAKPSQTIMTISGSTRAILTAERTALNFMQRMTGIATLTNIFVKIAGKYKVSILDTRKTTPTLRILEKYAVLCGGGRNHRMGLYDMILIKDNHRASWGTDLGAAIEQARRKFPRLKIEIEVENEAQLKKALAALPDWVLLDNMKAPQLRRCVKICGKRAKIEASGGITLKNIVEIAKTGIDAISMGCLTHSVPATDLSLEICR